jgi:hypothetical protein
MTIALALGHPGVAQAAIHAPSCRASFRHAFEAIQVETESGEWAARYKTSTKVYARRPGTRFRAEERADLGRSRMSKEKLEWI